MLVIARRPCNTQTIVVVNQLPQAVTRNFTHVYKHKQASKKTSKEAKRSHFENRELIPTPTFMHDVKVVGVYTIVVVAISSHQPFKWQHRRLNKQSSFLLYMIVAPKHHFFSLFGRESG